MTEERWQQIQEVFQGAIERGREERSAFLEVTCGNDEDLRKEVEALIRCDDRECLMIDTPALEVAACLLTQSEPELAAGHQISHFKVQEILGAGGMGEVYLAKDLKLGRNIALKLLPADLGTSQEQVCRFEMEARAASALNHPNIITIHEIGQYEGRHFIATEFIEGETLRKVIRHAKPHLLEVLDIAVQVANALHAAHSAGIVHLDIKPENIMLRPDGYVKVLDFGLAKLSDPPLLTAGEVNPQTALIMGTINYMSPEQVQGLGLDRRSDIFSLGVVIYEMVTGCLPFAGESPRDVVAAILGNEPPLPTAFSLELPGELQHIINRALCKDRENRYQTAKELADDLNDLVMELAPNIKARRSSPSTPATQIPIADGGIGTARITGRTVASPTAESGTRTSTFSDPFFTPVRSYKVFVILLLTAVTTVGLAYLFHKPAPAVPFQNIKLEKMTTTGKAWGAAISPDGGLVAYSQNGSIRVRDVATSTERTIGAADSYSGLTFSPDGNYLYYTAKGDAEESLYRVAVSGGDAEKIKSGVNSRVSFSPDGKRFAFIRRVSPKEKAVVISGQGDEPEQTLASGDGRNFLDVAWSPDGKTIVCSLFRGKDCEKAWKVTEIDVKDGTERVISDQQWVMLGELAWLHDGSGLLLSAHASDDLGSQIWHLSYPGGQAHKVTADFGGYNSLGLARNSLSLVSTRREARVAIWKVAVGNAAAAQEIASSTGKSEGWNGLSWTPANKIVYAAYNNAKQDIWEMDPDGSNQRQLTFGSDEAQFGVSVSPDGRYIVYVADRNCSPDIWRVNSDGSNPVQLTSGGGFNPFFYPDGQWVYYSKPISNDDMGIWKVPVDGGSPEQFSSLKNILRVSPDGKRLACLLPLGKPVVKSVAILSVEDNRQIQVLDLPGTSLPRRMQWSADGQALTYINTVNGVSNIWSQPLAGGAPVQLTDFKSETISNFAWSPDGSQLVCVRGVFSTDIVLLSNSK